MRASLAVAATHTPNHTHVHEKKYPIHAIIAVITTSIPAMEAHLLLASVRLIQSHHFVSPNHTISAYIPVAVCFSCHLCGSLSIASYNNPCFAIHRIVSMVMIWTNSSRLPYSDASSGWFCISLKRFLTSCVSLSVFAVS